MFTPFLRHPSAKCAGVPVLASLILNLLPLGQSAAAATPRVPVQAPGAPFVRVVNLPVNDVVYEKLSKKLLLSVPSRVGPGGNSITELDPATGAVETVKPQALPTMQQPPVQVRRFEDALKLPKGTPFIDPYGIPRVR